MAGDVGLTYRVYIAAVLYIMGNLFQLISSILTSEMIVGEELRVIGA
jgi:hypothetical protein